jgi:hypothetical protein
VSVMMEPVKNETSNGIWSTRLDEASGRRVDVVMGRTYEGA